MTSVLLQLAGVAIVAAALASVSLMLVDSLRRQSHETRRRTLARELLQHQVDAALAGRRVKEQQARFAWDGYRKFEVQKKVLEAADTCSFHFVPHDGGSLPPFEPGQFLTFRLRIPGQSRPTIRCYSLSDCYRQTAPAVYRTTIKRVPPPRDQKDAPPGLASNFFHDSVNEGDIIDVKAPSGKFVLDVDRDHPIVLIGGGVGVTPVLAMLNAVAQSGSSREVWFYYGVRNAKEHAMREHLETIDREHPNIHVRVCYSDPGPDDVEGRHYHHAGRVTIDLLREELASSNYEFYLCGPPPMMKALQEGLARWKVPKDRIKSEAFGAASLKPTAKKSTPAVGVVFSRSGKKCTWQSTDGVLLELAERQGVAIESGCRAGDCGTCLVAVRKGQFEYMKEPGFKHEQGSCLTCIAVPTQDLEIDA